MNPLIHRLGTLKRTWRQRSDFLRRLFMDILLVNLSLVLTYEIYHDLQVSTLVWTKIAWFSPPLTLVALVLLGWRGLYRVHSRYFSLYDFLNLVFIGGILAIVLSILEPLTRRDPIRLSLTVPVLFGQFSIGLLSGMRVLQRLIAWRTQSSSSSRAPRRTLIVGAGDAGEMIVREVAKSRHPRHFVMGFVDDNPEKTGLTIHGVQVLGTTREIPALVDNLDIEEILIAIPSAHGHELRRIVDLCMQTSARVRYLPAIPAILEGEAHLRQFRNLSLEDLLQREPVSTGFHAATTYLSGERVLITGAGGSIGSELARQIVLLGPASLILLGRGENSIYEIEQELIHTTGFCPVPLIADVKDSERMQAIFESEQPTVVFHTAAHKHVPLMEANPIEAIKNNVLGTLVTAETAIRYGVRKFIYVSTDKAVKPTSIMGATKRVGEMIISALAKQSETEFAIVRFGNVLGSRGSLVPVLKTQIERGGPVRITHPEMTRYFMTIPEAVQLIIQAGVWGRSGEIFILDMGEPIRILDLAKLLIRLYGLVPEEDIKIVFTGIRPGEKLQEQLYDDRETFSSTEHPKIFMVNNHQHVEGDWLRGEIERLMALCDANRVDRARELLMELAWEKHLPYPPVQRYRSES